MSITKRQKEILELLRINRFLSVERLAELTYSSPSSIRRDLTHLQNLFFVRRTHGGANIVDDNAAAPPLDSRMNKNITGKRIIAKKAAGILKDNICVMLDGSSTAGFMLPHIASKSNILLYTNNMITAINAINLGIETYCIGGKSVRRSAVLSGEKAYETVEGLHPDILFFSSASLDSEGTISDPTEAENYLRKIMLKNAAKSVFLCDSEKFGTRSLFTLSSVGRIDVCVFDKPFQALEGKCNSI